MQINLVPHHRRSHRRIALMLLLQPLEAVIHLLRRHRPLIDPPLHPLLRLHPEKSPAMIQNLQPLSIHHRSGPVGDRRHPVPQKSLLHRHIHIRSCRLWTQPRTSSQSHQQTNSKRTKPESPHPIGLSSCKKDNQPASHRVTAPLLILQSRNATAGIHSDTATNASTQSQSHSPGPFLSQPKSL